MHLLDQCYKEKSNSYYTGVFGVGDTQSKEFIKQPWQIQDVVSRKADVMVFTHLLNIDSDNSMVVLDGKVKGLTNLGYPLPNSYTLVIELTIDNELMEAWWINEFDKEDGGGMLFYPKCRLSRLKQEIEKYQNSLFKGGK